MASIEINFNIMGHPGRTDRQAEASLQGQEEEDGGEREDDLYQPRSLFPSQTQQSSQSGISVSTDSYTGTFGVTGHTTFGGNESVTRNLDYTQRLQNDPASNEYIGPGLAFDNREFSGVNSSFEMDNFDEDLRLNPLIDMNEPTPNFPVPQNLEGNNDSQALPQQRMPTENKTEDDRTKDGEDRKPGAIDIPPRHSLHQQHYHPHQPRMHLFPSLNRELPLHPNINQPLPNQDAAGGDFAQLKVPPVASVPRGSTPAPPGRQTTKGDLKSPPGASLPTRRSKRITAHAIQNETTTPNKRKSKAVKVRVKRSKTRTRSKSIEKMMNEVRTKRQVEALHTWFERLKELEEFKEANGHANVPQKYDKNHSLGIWVNKQRMEKKAKDSGKSSSLTNDKIELLEKVGFVWAKRKGQAAWEEKFRELNEYRQKHGHCNVPTKNKTNRALGRWISTQRANYKKWKLGERLPNRRTDWEEMERRIQRLEAIGFVWSLLPGGTTTEVDDDDEEEEEEEENSDRETEASSKKGTDSESDEQEKEE